MLAKKLKLSVIGVGSQSKKYIKVLPQVENFELVSIVDIDEGVRNKFKDQVATYPDVDALLSAGKPDVALVAVPHADHEEIVKKLLYAGVDVIKEKPHAISMSEYFNYQAAQKETGKRIYTAVKRRFDPVYASFPEIFRKQMGEITHFDARLTKNISDLGDGWRAKRSDAGGGALIDMGYHYIDLVAWYFGLPRSLASQMGFYNRVRENYDVEDTASLQMSFSDPTDDKRNIIGNVLISRVTPIETEQFLISGTNGTLIIDKNEANFYDKSGKKVSTVNNDESFDANVLMLNQFAASISSGGIPEDHSPQVRMIQHAYGKYELLDGELKGEINKDKPDFVWPIVSDKTVEAVMNQLHSSVSIYDRSGVFRDFEERYADYHGRKYALLSNSGTSAIFSMFEGLNLQPNDEVICPTYTFFATISPLMYTGAKPVFVDCGWDGNIDASKIEEKITDRTKALIVTHMWGIPCDMDVIKEICSRRGIKLLEDCSHAHGAIFDGSVCGSTSEAAAWSLQGQKIITGGEGGIMLTDDSEVYYRAVAQGHYNKRCKQEIPKDHPLHAFSVTGLGQKYRAHPLAIAMANEQFEHLDEWRSQKDRYAREFIDVISNFDFIISPNVENRIPSWYAFVFQVDEQKTGGRINAKNLFEALVNRGLKEADMPGSTMPVHNLPLFARTDEVMSRLYSSPCFDGKEKFPLADQFYRQAIKLPVWATSNDRAVVDRYKDGLYNAAKECALKR